ncbi:hypothetical protein [Microbacterium karelineae]|uniref:hypothetical protein n=1 Tax=Microbacterium karelineae TaxID=2654283 RepID=UPI0012E9D7EC|nr:hypothetical protein [Microbacterium karelineae]
MADSGRRPSIRWAGIAFGALFALAATAGLVIALDEGILGAVQEWARPYAFSIGPSTGPFALVIALGVVILALAVVALVRRARKADRD